MQQNPRYVFFGTPEFAGVVLDALLKAGFPPTALVANPDRPAGRAKKITPPPTKQLLLNYHKDIPILQPETLDAGTLQEIAAFAPDLFIVAAYAKILPQAALDIPRWGAVGVHPSLLPRLRGASPIQSAILSGEPETGVTLYCMDAGMDRGPVIAQERLMDYAPETDTSETLAPRLAAQGGRMITELMTEIERRISNAKPQDHAAATVTKKFSTADGSIETKDLERAMAGSAPGLARELDRKIRAFHPEPGAWTIRDGKRIKLLGSTVQNDRLVLKLIQPEGKRPFAPQS